MSAVTQNATCLILNLSSIGSTRKVPTSHVTVDAEEKLIKVSKTLLDSDELRAIRSLDNEGRQTIYSMCIASKIIKSGVYLCPFKNIEKVQAYLLNWKSERQLLIDALVGKYPEIVASDQERLRSEFVFSDYPGVTLNGNDKLIVDPLALAAEFSMSWQYCNFETPQALKSVSVEFFEREREKAAIMWSDANAEVKTVLRQQMADLVNHMADKLAGKDDGKPKVFRNTMVDNMNEFLSSFDARNIADDAELTGLVKKARDLMQGVLPDALRKNEGLRDSVKAGFDKIKAGLDQMLTEKPKRQFYFDEFTPAATVSPESAPAPAIQ